MNYGRNRYDGTRRATGPLLPVPIEYSSDPHGNQFGAAASIGYQFSPGSADAGPYGRVEYIDATIDSFQESGGPGALKIGKQRYKTTLLSLGGQASYAISMPWGVLMPYGRAEYQYQAGTTAKGRSPPSCCSIPPLAQSCRQPRSTRATGISRLALRWSCLGMKPDTSIISTCRGRIISRTTITLWVCASISERASYARTAAHSY